MIVVSEFPSRNFSVFSSLVLETLPGTLGRHPPDLFPVGRDFGLLECKTRPRSAKIFAYTTWYLVQRCLKGVYLSRLLQESGVMFSRIFTFGVCETKLFVRKHSINFDLPLLFYWMF